VNLLRSHAVNDALHHFIFYLSRAGSMGAFLDLEPVSWEEMQSLAKEVTSQPPDVVERVKRILEN
jgi:hypothetical protein